MFFGSTHQGPQANASTTSFFDAGPFPSRQQHLLTTRKTHVARKSELTANADVEVRREAVVSIRDCRDTHLSGERCRVPDRCHALPPRRLFPYRLRRYVRNALPVRIPIKLRVERDLTHCHPLTQTHGGCHEDSDQEWPPRALRFTKSSPRQNGSPGDGDVRDHPSRRACADIRTADPWLYGEHAGPTRAGHTDPLLLSGVVPGLPQDEGRRSRRHAVHEGHLRQDARLVRASGHAISARDCSSTRNRKATVSMFPSGRSRRISRRATRPRSMRSFAKSPPETNGIS